jgi:hypothetical protein
MCFGMQLVKEGAQWAVGNGHAIKILTDPWIPGLKPGSFSTLTPIPDGATVACLLADDHGAWDTDVVRSIFEEDIVTRILQIPVSRRGGDDFLSWSHTKFGDYTVLLLIT